ncbi:MAG: hypothetical protein HW414_1841 [Dehalococcoidia bacterium]|nr:hypothetical protein [Dehalococcoidia bacterium]
MRHAWEENFIYGNNAVNAKQFDGLKKLIDTATASDQVIAMSADGATLTLEKVDALIDAVMGGKPDMLLMSRRSRRKLNQLMRALGSMSIEKDQFGTFVTLYNGIPCYVSDWILDTHTVAASLETATTGAVCSTIYAFQMGEGALAGISGPGGLTAERIGALETKDTSRIRIKWYTSLVLFSAKKAAALIGVED